MDLNNEAGRLPVKTGVNALSNGSEQSAGAQSPIAQSPIAVVPAPAGDSPMDARAAARSLAAWRRDRDQHDDTSKDQPHLRARAERAAPHEPAQQSSPAGGKRCRRA
jgi:hypothetical protein